MRKKVSIAAAIVVCAALCAGAWALWSRGAQTAAAPVVPAPQPRVLNQTEVPAAPALLPPRTPPAGENEYRNEFCRFQLFYPDDLQVKAYDDGPGSQTIAFQDSKTGEGFQIFIVPYGDATISPERFKEDIPSGVIDDMATTTIDGAPADIFFSTDASLGDTREVWFIGEGFLYEVTTYKQFDAWLAHLMTTWQFLTPISPS